MSSDPYYLISVVRRAAVADLADLVQPVSQVVTGIQDENPALFALFGRSPAMQLYPVLQGEKSYVEAFVMTSDIEWNFGRLPEDPTHEVVFYNDTEEPLRAVHLRIQFFLEGTEATCPGLVAELNVGTETLGHADTDRTARIERLFALLIDILHPDFGHVALPDPPETPEWPNTPQAGWLTYLAQTEFPRTLSAPPPSVALPFAAGVKIQATPAPVPDDYTGAADAIAALQEVIRDKG